jgi:hypothetical protein
VGHSKAHRVPIAMVFLGKCRPEKAQIQCVTVSLILPTSFQGNHSPFLPGLTISTMSEPLKYISSGSPVM